MCGDTENRQIEHFVFQVISCDHFGDVHFHTLPLTYENARHIINAANALLQEEGREELGIQSDDLLTEVVEYGHTVSTPPPESTCDFS